MPAPKQPERYAKFFFELADILGEREEPITFKFESQSSLFNFLNKFYAFRNAIRREKEKTQRAVHSQKNARLETLWRNLASVTLKRDVPNLTVVVMPNEADPLISNLSEQLDKQLTPNEAYPTLGKVEPTEPDEETETSSFETLLSEQFGIDNQNE